MEDVFGVGGKKNPLFLAMQEYLREYLLADHSACVKVCQSPDPSLGLGSTVWDAGLVLCAFLESDPGKDLIRHTSCLELGSGTGIVAIAASLLGTNTRAVASDVSACTSFIKQNIGLNPDSACTCIALDWDDREAARNLHAQFDWILCADCVYDPDNVEALTQTILALAPRRGLIVSNEVREAPGNAMAEKQFIQSMLKQGFVGRGVHKDVLRAEWRCDDIHVVVFEKGRVKGA